MKPPIPRPNKPPHLLKIPSYSPLLHTISDKNHFYW